MIFFLPESLLPEADEGDDEAHGHHPQANVQDDIGPATPLQPLLYYYWPLSLVQCTE